MKNLQLNNKNLGWNLTTLHPDGTTTSLKSTVCEKNILKNKINGLLARNLDDKIVKVYSIPVSLEESEFYYIGSDTGREGRLTLFRWVMRRIVDKRKKHTSTL